MGTTPKTTGKVIDTTSKAKSTTKKAAKSATPAGPGTAKKRKINELENDVSYWKPRRSVLAIVYSI